MAHVKHKRKATRGVAALEFALVAPLLVMLMGGIIYFGLAIWSQYRLGTLVNAAARRCVSLQRSSLGAGVAGAVVSCASTEFNRLANEDVGRGICDGGSPQLEVSAPSAYTAMSANGRPPLYMLQMHAHCQKDLNMMNTQPGSALPTTLEIHARVAMPFSP